jgi:hypothetical protein
MTRAVLRLASMALFVISGVMFAEGLSADAAACAAAAVYARMIGNEAAE